MVLPFVILSVITCVLIILFFYESSFSECRMHMALRCEAGAVTGNRTAYAEDEHVLTAEDLWDGSITCSGTAAARRLCADKRVSVLSGGLLLRPGQRRLAGELRAVDPVFMLRLRQSLPSEGDDDDGT